MNLFNLFSELFSAVLHAVDVVLVILLSLVIDSQQFQSFSAVEFSAGLEQN